jgi:hypothetical protein
LVLAIGAALLLGRHAHLSTGVILLMALAGALASYAVMIATKVAIGGEQWVFYHHAGAAACAVVVLLLALKKPLLPYLDVTGIGLMILLACGRGGCFLVGCCHGQPSDWGITYGEEHVAAGFPRDLAGVRLTPVQAVEGLWVIAVAALASVMVWTRVVPGSAFSSCLIAYGGGRFLFEFWRGDRDRKTRWGIREAQWTSLLLVLLAVVGQVVGWLPGSAWQIELALGWGAVTAGILCGRQPLRRRLLRPNHVRELSLAVDHLNSNNRLLVERTSLGVQISRATFGGPEEPRWVYVLSIDGEELDSGSAWALARLVRRLRHPQDQIEVEKRQPNLYRLVVSARVDAGWRSQFFGYNRKRPRAAGDSGHAG